jgi:hypothetical protein
MKKLLVTLGGLLLAAGCSPAMIHTDGASSVPGSKAAAPQVAHQTVAVDYQIPDACRAELAGLKKGPEILDRYDTWFGYWETQGNPPAEVANTADGFRYEAAQAGANSCS